MSILSTSKLCSEETFYENLTLGLMKVLANVPRVTGVSYEKRLPCERTQITTWEQRHNIYLSDDMKRFYLSTDGFVMTWSYQYSPTDIRRVGLISISQLLKITLLRLENMDMLVNTPPTQSKHHHHENDKMNGPSLTPRSKIFEMSNVCGIAKVCLVYETPDVGAPRIYLLELENLKWQFLADTFTEYMRMTIAHLGLPYWELCFSTCGLPSWTEQLFLLIAPHLLKKTEPRRSRVIPIEQEMPPYNTLDPAIFKTTKRCARQVPKNGKN